MKILQCMQLNFRFATQPKPVLNNLNLTIHAEDFVILLGNNGSGKSTLLKLFKRYHTPPKNQIYFNDACITTYPQKKYAQQVCMLNQNSHEALFTNLTLYEHYLLKKPKDKSRPALQIYLQQFNSNLLHKLDTLAGELSGGEKQAFALAMCLLQPPKILLLDEHTSALDPKTSQQLMALTAAQISKHKITCVLITHDLDIALQYGNKLMVLANGCVQKNFAAAEKSILTKQKLLASCFA